MNNMGYQVYRIRKNWDGGYRFCGYGVPSYCEHPDCNEEIDRGMAFACGGAPDAEGSCNRYFCEKHRQGCFYIDPEGMHADDVKEGDDEDDYEFFTGFCERCATDKDTPFPHKDEHPVWLNHVLSDESWEEWREEEPEMVKEYQALLDNYKKNEQTSN